jgi:hypothetical protein
MLTCSPRPSYWYLNCSHRTLTLVIQSLTYYKMTPPDANIDDEDLTVHACCAPIQNLARPIDLSELEYVTPKCLPHTRFRLSHMILQWGRATFLSLAHLWPAGSWERKQWCAWPLRQREEYTHIQTPSLTTIVLHVFGVAFLSYLRLSVYMAIVSVAITLSFHLKSEASPLELRMAKPLGTIFWALSVMTLLAGMANYISKCLMRKHVLDC